MTRGICPMAFAYFKRCCFGIFGLVSQLNLKSKICAMFFLVGGSAGFFSTTTSRVTVHQLRR